MIDKHLVKDLEDYAEECYNSPYNTEMKSIRRQIQSFGVNYARKKMNGTYDRSLAIKGVANNFVPVLIKSRYRGSGVRTSYQEKVMVARFILGRFIIPEMKNAMIFFNKGYKNVGGKWELKKTR